MDLTSLVWIAAVIDSQAVIRVREAQGVELPMVAVHGPNVRLLQELASATGTKVTITRRNYSKAGCAEHCPDQHQHIVSQSGRWSLSGARATVLLHNIQPYVRLQVDEVREVLTLGLTAPFKPATVRKMVEIGWSVPDFPD